MDALREASRDNFGRGVQVETGQIVAVFEAAHYRFTITGGHQEFAKEILSELQQVISSYI